jgi:hypothetical protein
LLTPLRPKKCIFGVYAIERKASMSIFFDLFEASKMETLAERLGLRAGKLMNRAIKIAILVTLGLTLGLIFVFFALGKGFRKGFNEKKG